jgi:hypothetical protein
VRMNDLLTPLHRATSVWRRRRENSCVRAVSANACRVSWARSSRVSFGGCIMPPSWSAGLNSISRTRIRANR